MTHCCCCCCCCCCCRCAMAAQGMRRWYGSSSAPRSSATHSSSGYAPRCLAVLPLTCACHCLCSTPSVAGESTEEYNMVTAPLIAAQRSRIWSQPLSLQHRGVEYGHSPSHCSTSAIAGWGLVAVDGGKCCHPLCGVQGWEHPDQPVPVPVPVPPPGVFRRA